ncbi:MAG: hypothetical protein QXX55_00310 [Candidatus Pacearchaeota archaeon]
MKKGVKKIVNNLLLKINYRAQISVFIIVALVILVVMVLFYFFLPSINTKMKGGFDEKNPNAFIQTCLEDKIKESVKTISLQGGSIRPRFFFTYNNIPIEYLCYTNENFKLCQIQQPLLKQHIETEIKNEIASDVVNCFNSLKNSYENRNYDVKMEPGVTTVELLPKRIVVKFNYILTLTKGDTKRYDTFSIILNNNLYELISIVNSIIENEATFGRADPRIYQSYYNDLKIDLNLRDDGTKIYVVQDRNTGNKFQFASRSLVFPPAF